MTYADTALENALSYLCIGYGFNDEHVQPKLVRRVRRENLPVVVLAKELSLSARKAFLDEPPSKYLLIEEHESSTRVYCPDSPSGQIIEDHHFWKLEEFLKLLIGN